MKKYIFMAVAGMLALSSCSNEDNDIQDVQNAPRQMTFTAGYNEGGVTRATMDFSTKKVSFDANDEISILSTNNANVKFTTTAGGASATFSGTATAGDATYYAVYPYTAGLALSGTTITGIVIPTNQWNDDLGEDMTFTEHSAWDPKAPIAFATTTGTSLQFKNLCAILKVDFPNNGDAYKLTVDANEPLAGTFSLNTSTGTLTPTAGSTSVTVGGSDPWDPQISCYGARHAYVAIAPGTYTSFHVVAKEAMGEFIEGKRKASATFEAGKIYSMGEFAPNPGTSDQ